VPRPGAAGAKEKPSSADYIAIISEDETAYGGSKPNVNASASSRTDTAPPRGCLERALWLYYPRDISTLRDAYQSNSMFSTNSPEQLTDVGRGSLPSDIADPEGKEHDTIRSYAGNQTPLSQEAYLLGIVNAMRERHIQYIVLRSTNPVDQLFLTRYL